MVRLEILHDPSAVVDRMGAQSWILGRQHLDGESTRSLMVDGSRSGWIGGLCCRLRLGHLLLKVAVLEGLHLASGPRRRWDLELADRRLSRYLALKLDWRHSDLPRPSMLLQSSRRDIWHT